LAKLRLKSVNKTFFNTFYLSKCLIINLFRKLLTKKNKQ
jgi:hypothetical protein